MITSITLFIILLPDTNFGQVPDLKTASEFLLFTTAGALGNTGISVISGGAIGTNLGAITNFDNVNCPQYTQDATTMQCSLDLRAVFNEIHAIPITRTISAEVCGTFTPGVYHVNSAATLTTTVTLDAQNIPGSQFIFDITGAFWAAANTEIFLINGASANNIFWNVDGAVGAGAGATLKGTFISLAGAVDFGDGTMLEGRALTIAGAVNINTTSIIKCLIPVIPATTLIQPSCSVATGTITITTPRATGMTYSIDGTDFSNTTGIFTYVPGGIYTITAKDTGGCISKTVDTIKSFVHAPDLGIAADFVLYTTVGAVGNTGISVISGGAIGTNLGAFTGFEALVCDKYIQDAVTAQCLIDLQEAINEIQAIPITQIIPAELAGTFTAGVYGINTAATFTTSLTLDAQNNPDALFIFNVAGAFSAAATAIMFLKNGASANNIFWNIDGAVEVGAAASLKGTFISLAGSFGFGDGTSLEGRALSLSGAITINNSRITICLRPAAPALTVNHPSCADSRGTLTVTSPVTPGIAYRLDYCTYTNTTGVFNNLAPGTYTVTAKNPDGCISPGTTIRINEPLTLLTWSGSATTEWNNPSNWEPNGIPSASCDAIIPDGKLVDHNSDIPATCRDLSIGAGAVLTIEAGRTLVVNGTLTNKAGISGLLIKSNSSGTGSLMNNSAGVNATVERYINGASWGWHFLSSPVSEQAISGDFTPAGIGDNYEFYTWYEPAMLWINIKNNTISPTWNDANLSSYFLPGRGYLVAYESINPTKSFSGILNCGVVNYSLSGSGNSNYHSFNLLGNSYPCSIDWKAANGWNRDNLVGADKSFWIWNDVTGNYGTYSTANSSDTGTNGVSRYIASCQGYFVESVLSGGSIGIDCAVKVHSIQDNVKTNANSVEELKLKLTCEANLYSDEAIISFNDSNPLEGAKKYGSMFTSAPELWSVKNGKNYSINFLGGLNSYVVVPLTVKAGITGNYTITASQTESFGSNLEIRLEDRALTTFTNLTSTRKYTFQVNELSSIEERFYLHFFEHTTAAEPKISKDFSIYATDGTITIQSLHQAGGEVAIIDMMGRAIATGRIEAGASTQINMHGSSGMYIVSVLTGLGRNNTKIILK